MRREENTPTERLDDVEKALELLLQGRRTQSWLITGRQEDAPFIERDLFAGAYDSFSGCKIWYVTKRLAAELKAEGFVEGKKEWGYTDQNRCKMSAHGETEYYAVRKRHEEKDVGCPHP